MLGHGINDALLSDDERELLEQLPEVVPEDAIIATNAWNGSSLAYAISDREVLNTTWASRRSRRSICSTPSSTRPTATPRSAMRCTSWAWTTHWTSGPVSCTAAPPPTRG